MADYLTPYDELIETSQLGERRMQAANALNPLYQRDQAILANAAGVPTPAATPATAVAPNPLVRPPAPLSTMPVDKQIAWQQYNATATAQQIANDSNTLNQEIARRDDEHKAEMLRQNKSVLARTAELDPNDLKNYPLQRAKLARDHPIGSMSDEFKRALEFYDKTYENVVNLDTQYQKADENARRVEDRSRLETTRRYVIDNLGPDALARFIEREKTDPESAITGAMQESAGIRQENIQAQLENAGLTKEDIAAKYGGTPGVPFRYGAAEAAAKVRTNPQQEVSRVGNSLTDLMQEKREAGRKWTPAQESALQGTYDLYNKTLERAGIKLQPNPTGNTIVTSTPTPTPTRAGVQRPSATPSPTPPPPPLNPAYPEQWVGGKRYVQMPDGKLYLSKVQ